MEWLGWVLFLVLGFLGLVGVLIPGLPGAPLTFAGILALAWTHGFERISPWLLVVMGVLAALVTALDIVASAVGAKRSGGSRWGIVGAVAGAVIGLLGGPGGVIAGALVGAILGELIAGRSSDQAVRAGWGAFLGFVASAVIEGAFCLALMAAALVAHFWN